MQAPALTSEQRKRRRAMWLSVIGVMVVIVALWLLLLPRQLAYLAQGRTSPFSRWVPQEAPAPEAPKKSLMEVIEEQREQINQAEANIRAEADTAAPAAEPEQPTETPPSE